MIMTINGQLLILELVYRYFKVKCISLKTMLFNIDFQDI